MRQLRRSRILEREDPLEVFMDVDAENKGGPPEDIPMCTILHMATKNKEGHIFEEY